MKREVGPDGKYADLGPERINDLRENILGIEPITPPTLAEKIRSFWHRYEIFVILGSVVAGAGIGGILTWQLSESEQARKVFTQVVMVGFGIAGGAIVLVATNFIVSNTIVNVITDRLRRRK